jgi:hypothetical protein
MLCCAVHSSVMLRCCCPLRCSAVMVEFPLAAVMEANISKGAYMMQLYSYIYLRLDVEH